MNTKRKGTSITEHRKTAVSFRDAALIYAFDLGLTILNHVALQKISFGSIAPDRAAALQLTITNLALELVKRCLSFDFVGTSPSEASDEMTTIHVPNAWRDRIVNPATLKLFFALYRGLCNNGVPIDKTIAEAGSSAAEVGTDSRIAAAVQGGIKSVKELMTGEPPQVQILPMNGEQVPAALALDVLTRLASVRRGLFKGDEDRSNYLTGIIQGVTVILQNKIGISRSKVCYNAFCKLAGRLKTNYRLMELAAVPDYGRWIQLIKDFTIENFNRFDDD